jgi:DNA-binding transcriptional MerR regulator
MFRISEFARLSRTSARMLRHYDELGLLKPSFVDPSSGYRFYSTAQLPTLQRILAFQDMGLSLFEIAQLLAQPLSNTALLQKLEAKVVDLERDLERRQMQLSAVRARLEGLRRSGDEGYEVVLRPQRAQLMLGRRLEFTDELDLGATFDALEALAAKHEARAFAPPLVVYHDETREVEAAIPLRFQIPDSSGVVVFTLPAESNVACVIHTGGYDALPNATTALLEWVDRNGYRAVGSLREVYLRFGSSTPVQVPTGFLASTSSELVTELQLPVAKGRD